MEIIFELFKNLISKPMTVRFPHESIPIPQGYRGEHVFSVAECISCGLCAKICPRQAISLPLSVARIDQNRCNHCGLCLDACQQGAITKLSPVYWRDLQATVTGLKTTTVDLIARINKLKEQQRS